MPEDVEIYATGLTFPEGPAFDQEGNLYVCCRRPVGYIARVTRDRRVERVVDTGGKPQALALGPDDRLYCVDAMRREVLTVAADGRLEVILGSPSFIGPNDLCFGASGTLYFTDPGFDLKAFTGSVYRFDMQTRALTCLASDLGFSNGLAVSADEGQLYVAETTTSRLLCLDLKDPAVPPRPVLEFGEAAGPDGMEWLDDGRLAVALHSRGEISVIDTRPWTEERWSLGRAHPTNLIPRDGHLFVTDDEQQAILIKRMDGRC